MAFGQRICPKCGKPMRGAPGGAPVNSPGRIEGVGPTIVTDRRDCCVPPESTSEELYAGIEPKLLARSCCDNINGCRGFDARLRNPFWPSFAHPRWLPCEMLYDNHPRDSFKSP